MLVKKIRALAADALDRRFARLEGQLENHFDSQLDSVQRALEEERKRRVEVETELKASIAALDEHVHGDLAEVLRAIASEETQNRRALYEIRKDPRYDLPFTEKAPLVTICITSLGERLPLLINRALPSALAQTYENIEVVVVGERAGAEVAEAIARLGDDRVRFYDRTHAVGLRDDNQTWLASGAMSRNEAQRQARGLWIADLDDDDALTPTAIEGLLALAQSERVEVAYGIQQQNEPGGGVKLLGSFPPRITDRDWRKNGHPYPPWEGYSANAALVHESMRYFARELVSAPLNIPNDYFKLEKMVRAGVRFAMLDRVVYEYWPSKLWGVGAGLTPHPLLEKDSASAPSIPE